MRSTLPACASSRTSSTATRPRTSRPSTRAKTTVESHGLQILANQTGGQFGVGAVVAVRSLETVAATLDNYYSIAYRIREGRSTRTRKVEVRTKNKSWTVRTRKSLDVKVPSS